ncbi:microtubule-binding protein [Legionella norrlandica]|uniref:Microtubule-binding protein n=1 Tax=Legionella norrlandica TaxID=1498499 RepID=A0A0A2SQ70_9GAMM|nr:LegC2/C7 family Dot/Icm T4SS effector [Legionella norrlandica]KGP63285.1 microtubule-binding protein [Legionella norrlandica]
MTDTPANLAIGIHEENTSPDFSPSTNNSEKLIKNLKELETTQENFAQIKKHIGAIIDAIAKNRSLFSRAAVYWEEMPLWLKIIAGLAIVVPTLVLGIAIQVISLIVVSILSLALYVGCALILENHVKKEEHVTERLKENMITLADSLGSVIESFEPLRKQIAAEIEYFHQENERLNLNIIELGDQIEQLTIQAEQLQQTQQSLQKTKEKLEKTAETLDEKVKIQAELLQINQKELQKTREAIAKNELELSEKIIELANVKKELGIEIEKTESISRELKKAVESLSKTTIQDQNQRESFQNKLNNFLTNKEESFKKVADRICDAERALSLAKEELNFSNQRYQELLERQEQVLERLEQIKLHRKPMYSNANILSKLGILAQEENKASKCDPLAENNTMNTQSQIALTA